MNGQHLPVEKDSESQGRGSMTITLRWAAPFAINGLHVQDFFEKPNEQVSAFAIGLSSYLHQSMSYALYWVVINYLSEKFFTPRDIFASDEVKVHLGLTGPSAGKSFMDL